MPVLESNSAYRGGTEAIPEYGRTDDLFVPDPVKEAEEQDPSFSEIQIIGSLINKPDRTPG